MFPSLKAPDKTIFTPSLNDDVQVNKERTLFIFPGAERGCKDRYNYLCKFWFYVRCHVFSAFPNVYILPSNNTFLYFQQRVSTGDVAIVFWRHSNHTLIPPDIAELLDWRAANKVPIRIGVFHAANEIGRTDWSWYTLTDFVLRNYWVQNLPRNVQYIPLGGQVPRECPSQSMNNSNDFQHDGVNICNCRKVVLKDIRKRKYMWSFMGSIRSSRKELVNMLNASESLRGKGFIHIANGFGGDGIFGDMLHDPKHKYLSVVMDSQFVLCPCGNVMETHRIYEALNHGSIPVVQKCGEQNEFFPLDNLVFQGVDTMVTYLESFVGEEDLIEKVQRRVTRWWYKYLTELSGNVTKVVGNVTI